MGLYSWLEQKEGGFWGAVVVLSAFMIQIPSFGTAQSFGIYNMFFLQYFDDSTAAISLIGSINVGVFLGSGPIATFLMNHMSHRKVALIGATLSSIGLLAMPFAPNIIYMYGFYGVISGLGFCLVYVPSHVLSGLYYDKKRSLATGLATSGSGVGAIIFPLLVNFLVDNYGWRGSFYIVCGISMQNFVFASLLRPVPESLKKRYAQAAEELQVESSESDAYKDSISERNESERLTKDTSNPGVLKDTEQLPVAPSDIVLLSYSRKMSLESEAKETEVTNVRNMKTDKKADEDQEKPTDEPSTHDVEGQPYCSDQNECAEPNSPTHLLKCIPSHESDGNHSTPRNSLNEVEKLALTQKSTCAVLCDYAFIIYFINNILWNMGVVIILLFGPQYFLSVALDEQTSATVFSIGGFGAFAGSILGGFLGNIKQLRLDVVYIVMTVLTGIVCLLFPMSIFHNFLGLTCLYVVFSVVANIIMGLLVVAVAAIVGPEALGTGMGFVMLANGIGSVAAPPLIAWVFETTGSMELAFYLGGGFIILAGLIIILIPLLDYFYLEPKPSRKKPGKIAKECLHVYCM